MEKQKTETNEQFAAFKYYYQLDLDRSYSKVALKFKKSLSTIEKWGSSFSWQERVEDMSKETKKKAEEKAIIDQEQDYKQRNLKVIKRGILELAKELQAGNLKPTYKALIDLMREEERIRTGVDTTVQINHRFELRDLSNDEIKKRIQQKVDRILKFQDLKRFEDEPDPIIEAEYTEIEESDDEYADPTQQKPQN